MILVDQGPAQLPTGRFAIALIACTVTFYAGPLVARMIGWQGGAALGVTIACAALAAWLPAIILSSGRAVSVGRRLVASAVLVGAAVLRFASLANNWGDSQVRSVLSFLALVAVGVLYVYPGAANARTERSDHKPG
ncbi:MAG: hypothetical protein AAGJ56_05895 [Myxococcota bacterium]